MTLNMNMHIRTFLELQHRILSFKVSAVYVYLLC